MGEFDLAGQAGIRFRSALLAGNLDLMLRELPGLDRAHRVELILGAALRDGRDDFAAARMWRGAENLERLSEIVPFLMGEPDTRLDEQAAAFISARLIGDRWIPNGYKILLSTLDVFTITRQYQAGVGGLSLLALFQHHRLFDSVYAYYTEGSIHALGPRPLLLLALTNP